METLKGQDIFSIGLCWHLWGWSWLNTLTGARYHGGLDHTRRSKAKACIRDVGISPTAVVDIKRAAWVNVYYGYRVPNKTGSIEQERIVILKERSPIFLQRKITPSFDPHIAPIRGRSKGRAPSGRLLSALHRRPSHVGHSLISSLEATIDRRQTHSLGGDKPALCQTDGHTIWEVEDIGSLHSAT